MFEKSYEETLNEKADQPVECLGMNFPNDQARREYFLEKLREKLQDPEFRKIEGFPVGTDEDILALSDPPYHTACPNPWLGDFIAYWETTKRWRGETEKEEIPGSPHPGVPDAYRREPFAVDVSEGKTDPLYKAHAYHTKVPHLAIVPSILHYTEPDDVVLDGFCGSGMTGVAAWWCGAAPEEYRRNLEAAWKKQGRGEPKWGARRVVLNDLSAAATFMAANYNLPFDVSKFARAGKQILDEVEQEIGWMYETLHTDGKTKGRIEYTVWSEVFTCPDCAGEVVFLDEALDVETKRVRETFPCPHCGAGLSKPKLDKLYESKLDAVLGETIRTSKRKPALICYEVAAKRYTKKPDVADLARLEKIAALPLPSDIPTIEIPPMHMTHERARMDYSGITHIHHFFLPRAAHSLAALWRKAQAHPDPRTRAMLLFFVEQALWTASVLNRYRPTGYSQVNQYMTGVYYVASQHAECSPRYILAGKLQRLEKAFADGAASAGQTAVATGSAVHLGLPDDSIDYIFTDPPFGENIYYADLNFLVESWHRVVTNAAPEAIVDRFKKKGLPEYQRLMQRCFAEYRRVLKPGRWMTVVFHNSHNAVWNAIQEAMQAAGFVVADVRTLDKKQGSYRQVTSSAMKQDLVVSAYKPNGGLEERFRIAAGTEEGVWDFVRTHLKNLPVFLAKDGRAEIIAERKAYFLYDRMVAFHVQRGVSVPMSAAEFSQGLVRRFHERDGMFFLRDQSAEYDKKRLTVKDVLQLEIGIANEPTAIEWLRQQLTAKPTTIQELTPVFLKETSGGWQKHEKSLELSELLEQNFLVCDGKGPIPPQIVSWMKQSEPLRKQIREEIRNKEATEEITGLTTRNGHLLNQARGRWYIPDPNKAGDLEKLRERALLKEFWDYLPTGYKPTKPDIKEGFIPGLEPDQEPLPRGKKLKVIRLEAVRAGFKNCWQNRDYRTIIAVAQRIPENVLQEDAKLLMWYDQALTRTAS
ncbi:MAG: DNA methyltransferase [Syntrophales bacterium]|nr:DNA methyltransferase [Syntrophales bacterium]